MLVIRAICVALFAAASAAQASAQDGVVLTGGFDTGAPDSRDYARLLQQVTKPGARPGPASQVRGDDSCRWANDFECDEPGVGTGACSPGTDYSDCWRVMSGVEDDSCQWANDGECDEPRFGTGACTQATDATDCGAVSHLRFQNDQCDTAFNGVCEDPELGGNGACEARTDRADCFTRDRPLTINDHFFGRDDRVIMDTGTFPWSVIGYVTLDEGGTCTATLVADNVIATAAHCISENGRILADGEFTTGEGLPGERAPPAQSISSWILSGTKSASPARMIWTAPTGRSCALIALSAPSWAMSGFSTWIVHRAVIVRVAFGRPATPGIPERTCRATPTAGS